MTVTAHSFVDPSSLAKKRKQQAIEALQALSEDALKERIVIPLFKKMGMKCTSVDRRHEGQHRCDVLIEYEVHGEARIEGAQLKANEDIRTKDYVRGEVERAGAVAVNFDHLLTDGKTLARLTKFYWITTGEIDPIGRIGIKEVLGVGTQYFNRVDVWGVERLVDEIQKAAPELLPPLELLQIEQSIQGHLDRREYVFAAHSCYEAFLWHLRQLGEIDLRGAAKYLEAAGSYLLRDERRPLFYARAIGTYYKMWMYLIDACPDLFPKYGSYSFNDWPWPRIDERLRKEYPRSRWWLFQDVFLMLDQLNLLDRTYVRAPAGLSTLRACQILLRACYTPGRQGIDESLRKLCAELGKEDNQSIDGRCSLCTGVAVSVLSLAGEDYRLRAADAFEWLKTRGIFRFAYNQAAEGRHSLHYTARVLEGFGDYTFPASGEVDTVFKVFFSDVTKDAIELYSEYMRYRNIEEAEVASYIFPAFLRYFLIGRRLDEHRDLIAAEIENLVDVLQLDAESASRPAAEMYAAQSNLGSLVLGAVLGCEPALDLARQIVQLFHAKLRAKGAKATDEERLLWDSSVDRTQSFIEGYFQYWETILFLEERGQDVNLLLPEIGSEESASTDERSQPDGFRVSALRAPE